MIKAITVFTLIVLGGPTTTSVPNIISEKECRDMAQQIKAKKVFADCIKTVIVVPVFMNEEKAK